MLSLYDVLVNPINTEKYPSESDKGVYAFVIHPKSHKKLVKLAIEKIFNKKVERINISNIKGKKKRFKNRLGVRNGYKRAVVKLADGASLDLMA